MSRLAAGAHPVLVPPALAGGPPSLAFQLAYLHSSSPSELPQHASDAACRGCLHAPAGRSSSSCCSMLSTKQAHLCSSMQGTADMKHFSSCGSQPPPD